MSTYSNPTTTPEFHGLSAEQIDKVTALVIMLGDPEQDLVTGAEQDLVSIARELYDEMLEHGYTVSDCALAMLMLGYGVGANVGHIDGHMCAEHESAESEYVQPGYL